MESNSTAFLIKIKLRQSLGRPSRSDFVQSEVSVEFFMKYSTFFRDSTHILLTRDFISMMKEVPLYHQMNGGIHMNQLVTGKFIALKRKQKNLTQEQLAEKLGVSNKTISKWETGVSHS